MGCMESLLRTQVERFSIEDSLKLSQIEALVQEEKIDEKNCFRGRNVFFLSGYLAQPQFDKMLQNGNPVPCKQNTLQERVRMYTSSGIFIGIYEWNASKQQYKPLINNFCTPQDFQLRQRRSYDLYNRSPSFEFRYTECGYVGKV